MALPSVGGGYQLNDGNLNEVKLTVAAVPTTAADSATLTAAQLINGIIIGTPTATAAYTLPLATDLDALLTNSKPGSTFDFRVINTTTAGVITVTTNTGWTVGTSGSQGLMTVAATAGTVRSFRARKTSDGAWALYAIS
ncbi:hypothetical protein UFOVP934_35 [uncultured Caudovirales phage]|uniref:Uncharacterized protein n=1 Tax=uncultured Caudovirales phage TaxID=2100421 RepID=A0A6J5PZ68_9CAUD|nr:hypothetical protein UFOVP934_35 [uncultured Caudovirales phage]